MKKISKLQRLYVVNDSSIDGGSSFMRLLCNLYNLNVLKRYDFITIKDYYIDSVVKWRFYYQMIKVEKQHKKELKSHYNNKPTKDIKPTKSR
jgi:hypothetical protein